MKDRRRSEVKAKGQPVKHLRKPISFLAGRRASML